MFKYLLIFVFFMTGCAHRHGFVGSIEDMIVRPFDENAEIPEKKFDPELKPYIDQFIKDARTRGVNITPESQNMLVQFVYVDKFTNHEMNPALLALCQRFYGYENLSTKAKKVRWNIIEVLKEQTALYTEGDKIRLKELLYHELFHCFMHKGHLPPGVPGIMAPVLNKGSERIYTDWNGLVDEMFSPKYLEMIPDAN